MKLMHYDLSAIELPRNSSSGMDGETERQSSPLQRGVFVKAQVQASLASVSPRNSALMNPRPHTTAGFSLAASAAIVNDLVSDSCTRKTGHNLAPLCVPRKLDKGITEAISLKRHNQDDRRTEFVRSAHLVSVQDIEVEKEA